MLILYLAHMLYPDHHAGDNCSVNWARGSVSAQSSFQIQDGDFGFK